jgi:imidazoleglycerol-phosphate dehydratase
MATVHRQTKETDIQITLDLDGTGQYEIETGIGFLDHMLSHVAVHGLFDLTVQASGDLHVDPHHTMEDVALVLGQAFAEALGDKAGIVRMESANVPMDETLAFVAVDLSGRPYCVTEVEWAGPVVGGLPVTLISHFFESFGIAAGANVHARVLYGQNDHHKAEALFKALGRALDGAVRKDARRGGAVPSTKGVL